MESKNSKSLCVVAATLACFGLVSASNLFAVNPAPDGGYPGFTTAEGTNALKNLTTGVGNAAVGWYSLFSNTDGSYNTAVGAGTLVLNVGNQSTSEGIENTAVGAAALLLNTTGSFNTGIGFSALLNNTEGAFNTATGFNALALNSTGNSNTAIGDLALDANSSGGGNTATGSQALFSNSTAQFNTATGVTALFSNTTGTSNTAMGAYALRGNITGNNNTATGHQALFNATGNNNTALGYFAGINLTTGDNNIDIGYNVAGVAGEANTIRIGNTDITTTLIRGISGATIPSGATVLVASNGQLGTMTSSERFKRDIKPMGKTSQAVLALKPVTFRYKKEIDPKGTSQFGLVAEEVEKVSPDLVVRDEAGKPYSVRYEQINAMLLNEFLKEHKAFLAECSKVRELKTRVKKQEALIAEQQKCFDSKLGEQERRIEALRSEFERVSARLELNMPAPRTVLSNP